MAFCQGNALVRANTLFQQHRRRLYMWTSPDSRHRNQTDYIPCSQRWRGFLPSAEIRLGADCGSDRELLIAKFRLKLKKVGKTTRPFRYDLNQSLMIIQWKLQGICYAQACTIINRASLKNKNDSLITPRQRSGSSKKYILERYLFFFFEDEVEVLLLMVNIL